MDGEVPDDAGSDRRGGVVRLTVEFDGGPLHGKARELPEHVRMGGVLRVPVATRGGTDYRVAEYRIRGTVGEFERWER